jgi:hypothetical protein
MNISAKDTSSSLQGSMMKNVAVGLFAVLFTIGLDAQTLCPANIKPVPFHNSRQHQMVVQVAINDAGPFDFLLDTGSQITVVDRSLAAELGLPTSGNAIVAGVSFKGQIKFAQLQILTLGKSFSTNQRVLVYDMTKLQSARVAVRGLLGQDFLSGFNVFIDNAHGVLCMDDSGAMEASMKDGLQARRK